MAVRSTGASGALTMNVTLTVVARLEVAEVAHAAESGGEASPGRHCPFDVDGDDGDARQAGSVRWGSGPSGSSARR